MVLTLFHLQRPHTTEQVQMDSQTTMSQLIELDRARRNAQQAASALRETARWSELVREMDEVLDTKDLSQVSLLNNEKRKVALTFLCRNGTHLWSVS